MVKPPKAKKDGHMNRKGKFEYQPTHDRYIKCFKSVGKRHFASQYPSQRVMLIRDDGDIEYKNDKSKSEDIPPLGNSSDKEIEGEALIMRHVLNIQIKKDDIEQQ